MLSLDSLYPAGMRDVAFASHASRPEDLQIWLLTKNEKIQLRDEVVRLGLSAEDERTLVRRIVGGMLDQWNNPEADQIGYGDMWGSALLAVRTYFPGDRPLYIAVLSATIIGNGGCNKSPLGVANAIVPEKVREISRKNKDYTYPPSAQDALQLVINHMVEIGMTEDTIMSIWSKMLMKRYKSNFLTICIHDCWHGLKIGDKDLTPAAEKVNRLCLMRELKYLLSTDERHIKYFHPEQYIAAIDEICNACDWKWRTSEEVAEKIEVMIITCLAEGHAAKAFYVLSRFGGRLGFYTSSCAFERKDVHEAKDRITRGALVKATETRNYGVASALAEYLGDTKLADDMRELARHRGQKIALEFAYEPLSDLR